jgi:hypothetical protein
MVVVQMEFPINNITSTYSERMNSNNFDSLKNFTQKRRGKYVSNFSNTAETKTYDGIIRRSLMSEVLMPRITAA